MNIPVPAALPHSSISDSLPNSARMKEVEASIHALEQQVTELEEARYEALREVRDATRRVAELSLQGLEARMRLCALIECEPLQNHERTDKLDRPAVLRLVHMYFDEPGKYRLALYPYRDQEGGTPRGMGDPVWCSEVVYDETRPEGKGRVAIADAVRKAYGAAEGRGYRLVWYHHPADAHL